jgi:hypothetical protein
VGWLGLDIMYLGRGWTGNICAYRGVNGYEYHDYLGYYTYDSWPVALFFQMSYHDYITDITRIRESSTRRVNMVIISSCC